MYKAYKQKILQQHSESLQTLLLLRQVSIVLIDCVLIVCLLCAYSMLTVCL